MNITVNIQPTGATPQGFAPITLVQGGGAKLCSLDLEHSAFSLLPKQSDTALDFLVVAAAVYAIDKRMKRKHAPDGWTREIAISLPVKRPQKWNAVKADFARCLSFLTGDVWSLSFTQRATELVRPSSTQNKTDLEVSAVDVPDAVSLFSGGLDSLAGIINWLEANPEKRLLLVGHHDAKMPGPKSDQVQLRDQLRMAYPGRLDFVLARAGHSDERTRGTEITLRGRSLIFIAMGVLAATAYGPAVPLLIPENGTIALNVPLSPARRGSCSTRTAHPHYLSKLSTLLAALGIDNPILNPLRHKTKGEALTLCFNKRAKTVLKKLARLSVSCAKRGHPKHKTRPEAQNCGRCMPCIYRRAAMHRAGWDDEVYGDDICAGEVKLDDNGVKPNDLRACFSFLKRKLSIDEVAELLMASGSLDPHGVAADAAMVLRTMDEIRALLRAKATDDIKRRAGVS